VKNLATLQQRQNPTFSASTNNYIYMEEFQLKRQENLKTLRNIFDEKNCSTLSKVEHHQNHQFTTCRNFSICNANKNYADFCGSFSRRLRISTKMPDFSCANTNDERQQQQGKVPQNCLQMLGKQIVRRFVVMNYIMDIIL